MAPHTEQVLGWDALLTLGRQAGDCGLTARLAAVAVNRAAVVCWEEPGGPGITHRYCSALPRHG